MRPFIVVWVVVVGWLLACSGIGRSINQTRLVEATLVLDGVEPGPPRARVAALIDEAWVQLEAGRRPKELKVGPFLGAVNKAAKDGTFDDEELARIEERAQAFLPPSESSDDRDAMLADKRASEAEMRERRGVVAPSVVSLSTPAGNEGEYEVTGRFNANETVEQRGQELGWIVNQCERADEGVQSCLFFHAGERIEVTLTEFDKRRRAKDHEDFVMVDDPRVAVERSGKDVLTVTSTDAELSAKVARAVANGYVAEPVFSEAGLKTVLKHTGEPWTLEGCAEDAKGGRASVHCMVRADDWRGAVNLWEALDRGAEDTAEAAAEPPVAAATGVAEEDVALSDFGGAVVTLDDGVEVRVALESRQRAQERLAHFRGN